MNDGSKPVTTRHYDEIKENQFLLNNKSSTVHNKWFDYKKVKPGVAWEKTVPRGEEYIYNNLKTDLIRQEKIHKPQFGLIEPRLIIPDFNLKKPHMDIREKVPHKPACMETMP